MDLVRSWLGQALRATGAAVVIPVAILVALSLSSLGGGGLAGFGALSQLVAGPEAPGTLTTLEDGDEEIAEAVEELAAADPAGTGGVTGGGRAVGGSGPGAGGGTEGGGTVPRGDGDNENPHDEEGDPKPPGNGDNGNSGPPPHEPPPPPRRLVDEVGDSVKDVTSQTPVGPTVEEAIDGLLERCGQLACP